MFIRPRLARIFAFFLAGKRKFIFLAVISVLIIAGFLLHSFLQHRAQEAQKRAEAVFIIDGKAYSKAEISTVIQFPMSRGMSRDKAAREAFELYKKLAVAEKLQIKPSPQDIDLQKKDLLQGIKQGSGFTANYGPWFDLLAQANAVDLYISDGPARGYKGYAFDVFFGQHLQHGPGFSPKDLNNPKLVAADKAYAKERADFYHDQLKNNKMTPEQVIKELNNDRRLSAFKVGKTSNSVHFGSDSQTLWSDEIYYSFITDFISRQQQTGLLEIQVGKASVDNSPQNQADLYYYFVLLQSVPSTHNVSKQSFDDALKNIQTEYIGP